MGKHPQSGKYHGPQCSSYRCFKRENDIKYSIRSDSDGTSDEESSIKKQFLRTFHRVRYLITLLTAYNNIEISYFWGSIKANVKI